MSEREDTPSRPILPRPRHGSIVEFQNSFWFYEANGTYCNLYNHPDDVGIESRIALRPLRERITRVDPNSLRVRNFLAGLPVRPMRILPPLILPPFINYPESDDDS